MQCSLAGAVSCGSHWFETEIEIYLENPRNSSQEFFGRNKANPPFQPVPLDSQEKIRDVTSLNTFL